jgi:hypothetical protein
MQKQKIQKCYRNHSIIPAKINCVVGAGIMMIYTVYGQWQRKFFP